MPTHEERRRMRSPGGAARHKFHQVSQPPAPANTTQPIAVCLALTRAISRAETLEDIYDATLEALEQGLGVSRASILLFDADGVMRFKASRGLSEAYRQAV